MASSSAMTTSSSEEINTNDRSALVAFKSHLLLYDSQSNRVLNTNCIGVTCGKRHRRVTALNLHNMHLVGTIPPHIGNLSFLAKLDISGNGFQDPLPRELALLPRLKLVRLRFNNFSGEIPSWLGLAPKLAGLDFSNNHFIGTVPPEIFNLSSLKRINLNRNQLTGALPMDMCDRRRFSVLEELYAGGNNLVGSVPRGIHNCTWLRVLEFSANKFTGYLYFVRIMRAF